VSTEEVDYVEQGFYAETQADERVCPGIFLDQLTAIEDVTDRVRGAAPEGGTPRQVADAMDSEQDAIEEECGEAGDDIVCQVVSLFHGGQYQLYTYRRYAPVKLVFAPELQAGFYGGDPDNFTYPRWALDVSFVRAYGADGAAVETPNHFGWDEDGADEGELVFVTGNPGSTSRQATVAQLLYEQRARHPFVVDRFAALRAYLLEVAGRGPEAERAVRGQLFGVENTLKLYRGQLEGLRDPELMGRKIRWEREFRDQVMADPSLRQRYGTVWDSIAAIAAERADHYAAYNLANPRVLPVPHLQIARAMVAYGRELAMPEAERDSAYRGDALQETRTTLAERPLPAPRDVRSLLRSRLRLIQDWLEEEHPLRDVLEGSASAQDAAYTLLSDTQLADSTFRARMLDGGLEAMRASGDPLLAAALVMDSVYRELDARWDELNAAGTVQEERLADALFAVFGTDLPPDATFTLRITDGLVERYPYNGTYAAPFTTFHGLYDRSAAFEQEMPWTLPATFAARKDALELTARLNFVSTNDITGGNSGSPMISADAEVVGIAFDGNIEQLPNEFLFRDEAGRTVGVSSEGILEALRTVYQAERLVAELVGGARP